MATAPALAPLDVSDLTLVRVNRHRGTASVMARGITNQQEAACLLDGMLWVGEYAVIDGTGQAILGTSDQTMALAAFVPTGLSPEA
jgi:hypothetical protein